MWLSTRRTSLRVDDEGDQEVNERLQTAASTLGHPDRTLSPLDAGRARETALVDGLVGLAEEFGKEIGFTRIDADGEMAFHIAARHGLTPDGERAEYGPGLAEMLSMVPRRTGIHPTETQACPENAWCRINHFDAERLILMAAAKLADAPSSPKPR